MNTSLPCLSFQLRDHHPPDLAHTLKIRKRQHLLSFHSKLSILLTLDTYHLIYPRTHPETRPVSSVGGRYLGALLSAFILALSCTLT